MTNLQKTVIIGLLVAFPLIAGGETAPAQKTTAASARTAAAKPAYKPPLRGAPAGRIGGGTRGATERESFSLLVLTPDHVGFTTQEQPCLYWYISKPTSYPVELTVTERKAVKPIMEKTLKGVAKGGIQSACLADYGVKLQKDIQYKWYVTLVTDPEHRSKDIMAGGMLSVVEPKASLLERLKSTEKTGLLNLYAEEGLWYDALGAISNMIELSPNDIDLRGQRASLLEQVGLAEAAESERKP
jgi:hypothetical protein